MIVKEIDAKNIFTNSPVHGDYTINPYCGCVHRCMYCYAQYLKDWTGHEQERWGDYIDVKNWKPLTSKQKEQLRGKTAFISSATDPYQPIEREYHRTHKLLEDLLDVGMDITIVTKSDLVIEDWELLQKLNATVAISINTLDEAFKSDMDRASSINERIRALEILHEMNIHAVCFVSPIFPGITDVPAIIEAVTGKCDAIWIEHLVLNGDYKGPILYYVKTHYPQYFAYYDEIFNKGNLQPWWDFDDYMEQWCKDHGYEYKYGRFPREHREFPTVSNFRGHKGK